MEKLIVVRTIESLNKYIEMAQTEEQFIFMDNVYHVIEGLTVKTGQVLPGCGSAVVKCDIENTEGVDFSSIQEMKDVMLETYLEWFKINAVILKEFYKELGKEFISEVQSFM